MIFEKILVSDFDGTMTQQDFYSCAVHHLLSPQDLQPWHAYTRQEISHFEALRSIFCRIRVDIPEVERVLEAMKFDALAKTAATRLTDHGWKIVVVSNGCGWYIQRLLQQHDLHLEFHSNPGEYSPKYGLRMRMPTQSPYYCDQFGVSKVDVVRHALQISNTVAFAGDGRPDLEPALMVRPELRFATGWLATQLKATGESFQPFSAWSEISKMLCEADL